MHGEGSSAQVPVQSHIPTQSQLESSFQVTLPPFHARHSICRQVTLLHDQDLQQLQMELDAVQAAAKYNSSIETRPPNWEERDYAFQLKLLELQTRWKVSCQMKRKHLLSWGNGEIEPSDPQEDDYERNFTFVDEQNKLQVKQAKGRLDNIERKRAETARQHFMDALEKPQGRDDIESSIAALIAATAPQSYEQMNIENISNFRKQLEQLEKHNKGSLAMARKEPLSPVMKKGENQHARFLAVYQMQMVLLEKESKKRLRTDIIEGKGNQLPPALNENKNSQAFLLADYHLQLALLEYQNQKRLKMEREEQASLALKGHATILKQQRREDHQKHQNALLSQQHEFARQWERENHQKREMLQLQSRVRALVAHQEMRMEQQNKGVPMITNTQLSGSTSDMQLNSALQSSIPSSKPDPGSNPFSSMSTNTPAQGLIFSKGEGLQDWLPQLQLLEQKKKELKLKQALQSIDGPVPTTTEPSESANIRQPNPAIDNSEETQNYQVQLMLLEQHNKRLLQSRKDSAPHAVSPEPVNRHLQDYQMQLIFLEQQNKKRRAMEQRISPMETYGTRPRLIHDYVYELVILNDLPIKSEEELHHFKALQSAQQETNVIWNHDQFLVIKGAVALLFDYLDKLRMEQSDILRLCPNEAPIFGQIVSIHLAHNIQLLRDQSMIFQDASLRDSLRETCTSAADLLKNIQVKQDETIAKYHASRGTKPFPDIWGHSSPAWDDNFDAMKSTVDSLSQRARDLVTEASRQQLTLMIKRITHLVISRIGQASFKGSLFHCEEIALRFGDRLWEQLSPTPVAEPQSDVESWVDSAIYKQLNYHHHLNLLKETGSKKAWLDGQVKRQLEIREQEGHQHYCLPAMRVMEDHQRAPLTSQTSPGVFIKQESSPEVNLFHADREASMNTEWTRLSTPARESSVDTNWTRLETPGRESSLESQWTSMDTPIEIESVVEESVVDGEGDVGMGMDYGGQRTLPIRAAPSGEDEK